MEEIREMSEKSKFLKKTKNEKKIEGWVEELKGHMKIIFYMCI